MKRLFFIFVIFLLLVNIIDAGESDEKVDEKVIEKISSEGKAKVIVVLKDEVITKKGMSIKQIERNRFAVKNKVLEKLDSKKFEKKRDFATLNGFSGELTEEGLQELLNDESIGRIEIDDPMGIFLIESVPLINASLVHTMQFNGENITGTGETICVIDTGINYTHPALGGCLGEGCKILSGYDFVNQDTDPIDDHGHGSHVAGIIASNDTVYRGVAPNASLIAIKVLDSSGNGYESDIIAGIEWCISNASIFGITGITMSLGSEVNYTSYCDNEQTLLSDAINNAVVNNILVSVASGNSGNTTAISSPACIENATAVASSNDLDIVSSFSNRASILDLLAPGENIFSVKYIAGFESRSGTSMAAPHVSAAAALVRQFYRLKAGITLNPLEIENNLTEYGIDINDTNGGGLIFKRIDIYNALGTSLSPEISITLSNNILELNQENLTININYESLFLDSYNANVSLPNGTLLSEFTTSLDLTTENLTELGNYKINAWANDTNGNENLVSNSFLVRDTSGLSSNSFIFNTVDNNNFTSNTFVEFNISVGSKYNLANVTFYHNFTDWNANYTYDLNVNEIELIFNSTFAEGIYLWGIETCDVNNYCVMPEENKTLYIDLNSPIVNAVNTTSYNKNNLTLHYNVSDLAIDNCKLFLNGNLNSTDEFIITEADQTFSLVLNNGNYDWGVNCTDKVNKIGASDIVSFSVSCSPDWNCDDYDTACDSSNTRLCKSSGWVDEYNCGLTYTGSNTVSCTYNSGGTTTTTTSNTRSSTTTISTDQSVLSFQANKGDKKNFDISKDVGISGLEIEFKNAVSSAKIIVEKQSGQPSGVSAVSNVYRYIEIDANFDESAVKEAKIEFKVERSWININALGNSNNIFLSRYHDGRWQKLETLTAGTDGVYQKYVAYTPGFSYFAISADKNALTTTGSVVEDTTEEETNEETSEETSLGNPLGKTIFERLTGGVATAVSSVNTTYSLIGLGVLVIILVGFLVLRFNRNISRTKGISFKSFPGFNLRWLVELALFNIFKKKEKLEGGKWKDVSETEKMKKEKYNHEFEIKNKYGTNSSEENAKKKEKKPAEGEKESFFTKLKNKFKRKEKPKQNFELK